MINHLRKCTHQHQENKFTSAGVCSLIHSSKCSSLFIVKTLVKIFKLCYSCSLIFLLSILSFKHLIHWTLSTDLSVCATAAPVQSVCLTRHSGRWPQAPLHNTQMHTLVLVFLLTTAIISYKNMSSFLFFNIYFCLSVCGFFPK